jgi:acetyltransferase-like isoleucine patch superfamily enzyme
MDSILPLNKLGKKGNVLLVFSARDTEKGKFTFFSMTKDLQVNIIYINDYSNQWYLNGTPEFESHNLFIKHLEFEIYKLIEPNGGEIYTLGSSMGAYAALKYGSFLRASKIMALGPESELMLPHGRSVSSVKVVPDDKGNISLLTFKKPENVIILSGNNDIVDFYCACEFKEKNNNINVSLINNRTHVVAKYINANFGLATVISDFFEKNDNSFLAKMELSKTVPLKDAEIIRRFEVELKKGVILVEGTEGILRLSEELPQWSMIQFYAAKIWQAKKDKSKCIEYLEKAITAQVSLGRARLLLAGLRLENNEIDQALFHFNILFKNPLTYAIAILGIDIYLSLNKFKNVENLIILAKELKLSLGQIKNLEHRRVLLEKKLTKIKLTSSLNDAITLSGKYISVIDLETSNYIKYNETPQKNITIKSTEKIEPSTILMKSGSKLLINLNFISATSVSLYIGRDCKGSIDINVYRDGSTIYVGNNVTLHGVTIDINASGSICIIGNSTHISSGTVISFDSNLSINPPTPVVIIGDNSIIHSHVLICNFTPLTSLGASLETTSPQNNCIIIGDGVSVGPLSRVMGSTLIPSNTSIRYSSCLDSNNNLEKIIN